VQPRLDDGIRAVELLRQDRRGLARAPERADAHRPVACLAEVTGQDGAEHPRLVASELGERRVQTALHALRRIPFGLAAAKQENFGFHGCVGAVTAVSH
jgi:hypothetical protein